MKVKKLIKHILKDNYISIVKKKKEIFFDFAENLTDEEILNSKIKYYYTDNITKGTESSSYFHKIKDATTTSFTYLYLFYQQKSHFLLYF